MVASTSSRQQSPPSWWTRYGTEGFTAVAWKETEHLRGRGCSTSASFDPAADATGALLQRIRLYRAIRDRHLERGGQA